jgi:APA family basic amino acid/polyamine antiporter
MAEIRTEVQESTLGAEARLERSLGLFDAILIVMGAIIGTGVFVIPHIVARQAQSTEMIVSAWLLGGLFALAASFIFAELASKRPRAGGLYVYLREAYHPVVAFMFGWSLLLIIQTGAMASVAVVFARYFVEATHVPLAEWMVAAVAIAALTFVNCLGVRTGATVQNGFMLLKIAAILAFVICGLALVKPATASLVTTTDGVGTLGMITTFGAVMISVLYAYDGCQMASFMAGEVREPRRNLPLGLIVGVAGVVALYLLANLACIAALGVARLGETPAPASEIMRLALGERGATLVALGITISALGYLSSATLTTPRVYFAMANDGIFFKKVAWVHPRTRVPVVAIVLQGVFAIVIASSGKYEQILTYVMSADYIFLALSGIAVFIFRRRARQSPAAEAVKTPDSEEDGTGFGVPGHPITTVFFILVCVAVAVNMVYKLPGNTLIGMAIVLSGIPVYVFWRWLGQRGRATN